MFKHILALIILSVLAVLFKTECAVVLHWLMDWHHYLMNSLSSVFSSDKMGVLAQASLALILIPFAVAAIAACGLWVVRRKMLPFLPEVMWVIWLVLVSLITINQGVL